MSAGRDPRRRVNYQIGTARGPAVFKSETSRLLNKKHLLEAQDVLREVRREDDRARPVRPIVRTFAPFVAGSGG
jgi:membrane-associated protein